VRPKTQTSANNPAFAPILGDEATILGKAVAILRRI